MHHRLNGARLAGTLVALLAAAACSDHAPSPLAPGNASTSRSVEGGQQEVLVGAIIHRTVEAQRHARAVGAVNTTTNLYYHGGTGGIGVETTPAVYLVLWGSQWNSDPSNEAGILESFLGSVGSSSWLNSVTQYCEAVASGTFFCNGAGTAAGNQAFVLHVWADNGSQAPKHPRQSQFASEATRAAAFFGNTTAASNASAQYVVATAHGYSASGFGTQYCAYHSSTSSQYGNIAYTNLPYITDAGASCGANFNGLGPNAGITIVEGHELAETMSDQFPSSGWLDSGGSENGDKCAWISSGQGASADVTMPNGNVFPVQSLWSNAYNGDNGGCVLAYP